MALPLCVQTTQGVKSIVDQLARPVTTYGLEEGAQIRAIEVRADNGKMHFTVQRRNGVVLPDLPIVLNLPGLHNVSECIGRNFCRCGVGG
jgi:UDP-N-acetylmuramate--alanine ligase